MKHSYEINLTEHSSDSAVLSDKESLKINFQSHDDLHEIVEKLTTKGLFDENETKVFVVGLKMFVSVMLAHRNDPLFSEISPHFGNFMKKLKS